MDQDFLRRLKTALDELGPELEKQNAVPTTALAGVGEEADNRRKFLTSADQLEMRRGLRKLNDNELYAMLGAQGGKRDVGIPIDAWMYGGGNATAIANGFQTNPTITRALDTSGASALIRQDLEPILYELFIRSFPAWDRISKEPANGLVHAYNKQTTYGDAQFMGELGTVTDDVAAYTRATTPISVLATRRGVTIKAQAGTLAGGAGFNPEQLEMRSGLLSIAHKMQKTIFQGNATVSTAASNGTDEDGAYDAYAFDGLRKLLKGSGTGNTPVDVDPTAGTPEDMRAAFDDAVISAIELAGNPKIAYMAATTKGQFDKQQDKNVRYNDRLVDVGVGVITNVVNTSNGPIPLFVVPGDSIGTYTSGGDTVSDVYFIDEQTISVPYLGSEGPTVLDIPIGVSGQLSRLFIIFGMWGFAEKVQAFSNKVRVVQS